MPAELVGPERPAPAVGVSLQPEQAYLDRVLPLAGQFCELVEVTPETLWFVDDAGALRPNGYHREIADFVAATGMAVVAHGVGLSLGTADPADDARFDRWLARIAADRVDLDYAWYSDHLGATILDGKDLTLPVAVPLVPAASSRIHERLLQLQVVVPAVGVENAVHEFLLGDWLDEPAFLADCLRAPGMGMVLDLHNVFTMASRDPDRDVRAWLERVDLDSVIEIHVSGGRPAGAGWLPGRPDWRLDSHDDDVPEPVWELLEEWAPRCPQLRAIVLERMEGSLTSDAEIAAFAAELGRLRRFRDGLA